MGLFDFLKKKPKSAEEWAREHHVPDEGKPLTEFPELRDAWLKLETDHLDEAKELAERHVQAADPGLATEARKLVALIIFRRREYATALPAFERIAETTGMAGDVFNVMTCRAMLGDVEGATQAFEKTVERHGAGDTEGVPSLPFIWYYFGCALRDGGHPAEALPMVENLRKVYEELKITDDTFVYIRGVPFLSHTLSLGLDVFRALAPDFDARSWLSSFAKHLDEEGQAYIEALTSDLPQAP